MQRIFGDDVRRFQNDIITTEEQTPFSKLRKRVGEFYDDPAASNSRWSKAYLCFYISVVITYLISYIMQTEMQFRNLRPFNDSSLCPQFEVWHEKVLNHSSNNSNIDGLNMPKYAKFFISRRKFQWTNIIQNL